VHCIGVSAREAGRNQQRQDGRLRGLSGQDEGESYRVEKRFVRGIADRGFRRDAGSVGCMGNELIVRGSDALVPVQTVEAGEEAAKRFIEFFTANIRNPNTRAAYVRSVASFFRWCEERGLRELSCSRCMSQVLSRS